MSYMAMAARYEKEILEGMANSIESDDSEPNQSNTEGSG